MQIQEAQKHTNPDSDADADPDSERWKKDFSHFESPLRKGEGPNALFCGS
jgi:hypothetical protein